MVLKYQFSGNFVVKSGQVFDDVQGTVYYNRRNRRIAECPASHKKETLEEKVQKTFIELFPKDKIDANQRNSLCRKN